MTTILDPGNGIRAVQNTRELARILSLPRRIWTPETAEQVAAELTPLLQKPGGSMSLRAIQAQALLEAGIKGGLFAPIRVGGGKTLLSLLVFLILDSRRPLLVIPAKLIDKTKRDWRALATHWRIPNFIQIKSYEWLGRIQAQTYLEKEYQPDVIVLDEAQYAKNRKAAVTKRLGRYKKGRPTTKFVSMSGSITKRSLKDWAHIISWCLNPNDCPVPIGPELDDWADALDELPAGETRMDPGHLIHLCNEEERREPNKVLATRKAFGRRLWETKGVVATIEKHEGCSLTIEGREIDVSKQLEDAFELLRTTWHTPDGWPLTGPLEVWRVARELALGFYNRWEPRPPLEWLETKREWSRVCRDILENNRRNLDSLLMVTNAIYAGHYPEALPILEAWQKIEPTFTPHSSPVWIDESCVRAAALWALERPGIVWCEHVPFAEKLAKYARLAYYGRQGRDSLGRFIDDHPASESLIASVASSGEGRNLQKWNRNLITSCPSSNGGKSGWEQIIGRTHRPGQEADEVTFDVFVTAIEHVLSFRQAIKDAEHNEAILRQSQKILYADKLMPTPEEMTLRTGFRWKKKKRGE